MNLINNLNLIHFLLDNAPKYNTFSNAGNKAPVSLRMNGFNIKDLGSANWAVHFEGTIRRESVDEIYCIHNTFDKTLHKIIIRLKLEIIRLRWCWWFGI